MLASGTNALSSSMLLVCECTNTNETSIARADFKRSLRSSLPSCIRTLRESGISPVDILQAALGPGIAEFSRAKRVLNPDDSAMSVHDALVEISKAIDDYQFGESADLDQDSRFAITFFESYGYEQRPYGDAEGIARARNVSVQGVVRAGIIKASAGIVQILKREELPSQWDPLVDDRICAWEATQHLIKKLAEGEESAASLLSRLKTLRGFEELSSNCIGLAHRLYTHCEKTRQADEARAYSGLISAWPDLVKLATSSTFSGQQSLFSPQQ